MQNSRRRPIRFGIMCYGTTLQQWQAQCIERLVSMPGVQLALLIVDPLRSRKKRRPRLARLVFQIYSALFVRPALVRSVDMSERFSNVPTIYCKTTLKGRYSEYFSDEDLGTIQGFELEFILRFAYGILRGKVLHAARYGIWSFHHDDEEKIRGGPPCFWEIYNGDHITGAMLQRITGRLDAGVVLRKGYFRTSTLSYSKNIQNVYSESSRWPAQVCTDLRSGHADYLVSPASATQAKVFRTPTNRQTILFMARLVKNRLERLYHVLFRYSIWNIGLVNAPVDVFLSSDPKPEIQWLPQPRKGEFKADPFGLDREGNLQIFFENFDYRRPKGIICTAEIAKGALITQPKTAIELPVHMSYPYVFAHKGEIYCIPETNRAREISLYKAERFPFQWTKIATLLENVSAIDSTVFEYNGIWWLMYTDREKGGDANLYAWYAPQPWGPWKPHEKNPVKSDVRSARPGGTPFTSKGLLYRPAQDCSKTGGGRVLINRLKRLTPTEFQEELAAIVEPDVDGPYPKGLHTLSKVGDVTLVDGKRFEFLTVALLNNLVKGVRRLLGR